MNSPNQHIPVNNIDPGKNVGDGEGSVQVHLEEDLMQTVFPHPTLSEMMHESVLDAYGQAIHF